MNRKDFFRVIFGSAAVAAGLSNTALAGIAVNAEPVDTSIPTIGINKFKSVGVFNHTRELPSEDGWRKVEATGERTFTFRGVGRCHLEDIREACVTRDPIKIRFSGYGKTVLITGKVTGCELTDHQLDFTLDVEPGAEARLL